MIVEPGAKSTAGECIASDNVPPKLSIVIVNYNGKHFMDDCLESIAQCVTDSHEVIVIDNASSDASADYIQDKFPFVRLIRSDENLGFTGGNNRAAKIARGEILLLLNNDTFIKTNINPLLKLFDSDDDLGVVGCRMRYGDGRLQHTFGYTHTPCTIVCSWLGLKRIKFLPKMFRREVIDEHEYDRYQPDVSWVSGAFLMVRRNLWNQLGGFDDRYFMYMEDVDLCRRITELDYRVAYSPDVEIVHYEGSGKPWIGRAALTRTARSYLIYTYKYYGLPGRLFVRFGLAFVFTLRGLWYWTRLINPTEVIVDKRQSYINLGVALFKDEVRI